MKNLTKITILSQSYPSGKGEVFLENELKVLVGIAHPIELYNAYADGDETRVLPAGVRSQLLSGRSGKMMRLKTLMNKVYRTEIKKHGIGFRNVQWLGYFAEALHRKRFLEKNGLDDQTIYYSFWTDEWALALALLKKEGKIKRFYSRVHGYDLFEERSPGGKIPFRDFVLQQVDRVYCVSDAGRQYLNQKYAAYQHKFFLFSLGVFDHGMGKTPEMEIPLVVSCSNVIPLKRVHLIAEMLGKFNHPLRWVHFGAGKDLEKVRELVKGFEHVQAEFPGHVSNADLISFYQNNAVHAFVHMSETEGGIPVSIQEAVSFGIPIIAANAGGVPEIVNAQTGVLLSHAFDAQAAVNALSMIIETMSCDARKRESIRNVWKLHFDAQKKYTDFAEHLIHE